MGPTRSQTPFVPRASGGTAGAGDAANMGSARSDPLARPVDFGRRHVGEWCAAALVLAVPVATGTDLWRQVGWESETGRLLFLALALLGVCVAALYVAARIAVRVIVAPGGITAVRGPWRRELRWHEVARLLERTEVVDGRPLRYLVAEAHDGRRLHVHEDLVADYPRFRATVFAAQQRWRAMGAMGDDATADQSGAYGPLYLARETPHTAGLLVIPALVCGAVAIYLWVLVVPLRVLTLVAGGAALGLGLAGLLGLLGRRSFAFDDAGVEAWSRFPTVRLDWHDLTHAEQRQPRIRPMIQVAGWASDRLHALVAGRAIWSGDDPWPRRAPEVLLLRGGGRRLALPLHRLRDPEAVAARVARGVQVARLTARLPVVPVRPAPRPTTSRPLSRPISPSDSHPRARITRRLPALAPEAAHEAPATAGAPAELAAGLPAGADLATPEGDAGADGAPV